MIEPCFPASGPYTPEALNDALEAMAELAGWALQATKAPGTLADVATLPPLLETLERATRGQRDLYQQLSTWAGKLSRDKTLRTSHSIEGYADREDQQARYQAEGISAVFSELSERAEAMRYAIMENQRRLSHLHQEQEAENSQHV